MDKTQKLKDIILSRYSSIREFAKFVEIPSTTLTSALDKGIGGMAIDRIIKICEILDIDIKTFEPLNTETKELNLTDSETTLLFNYNKLNNLGKDKLIEYSNDLIETPKYIETINNITELITTLKEEPQTLGDMYTTIAAHDDDLTDAEKTVMDIRILEALKKRQK